MSVTEMRYSFAHNFVVPAAFSPRESGEGT